jgi:hypothetical protein
MASKMGATDGMAGKPSHKSFGGAETFEEKRNQLITEISQVLSPLSLVPWCV